MDIGVDIENVNRFKNLKKNDNFIINNFTKDEIRYATSKTMPEIHFCGIFCAKEALLKTLDCNIQLCNIEIRHDKKGKPHINLISSNIKGKFKLSIAHTKNMAIAQVLRL